MRPRAFTVAIVACFTAAATRPVMGAGFDAAAGDAFASAADRTLTVIHEDTPDTYHVTQTLETMPGSRNMAVDPATRAVYLAGATFEPVPAGTAVPARQRPKMVPGTFVVMVVERR